MATVQYAPGLENIVAAQSGICTIDLEAHQIIVRGYSLTDIGLKGSFEEIAYLLLFGHLPDRKELKEFSGQLVENRGLPKEIYKALSLMPKTTHPMDQLRTGVSMLAGFDPDLEDNSHEANVRKAIRLIAKLPTLVAHGYATSKGKNPIKPDSSLPHARNFLHMVTGKKPSDLEAKIFETSMILYVEHELAASTFATRVVASTLSDIYGAITSGISALKGSIHGGANEKAMKMLLKIGEVSNAEPWVRAALQRKELIMGFGHRVYRRGLDPRAEIVKKFLSELGERLGQAKWYEMAVKIEEVMLREKQLYPNVDYFVGPVYYLLGIPIELDTAVFVGSRVAGWAAHIIEQHDNNRIFRPRAVYTGPRGLSYVPIEQRS